MSAAKGRLTALIREDQAQHPTSVCKLCFGLDPNRSPLPDDIRAELPALVEDPFVSPAALAKALSQFGLQVSETSVRRHRRAHQAA